MSFNGKNFEQEMLKSHNEKRKGHNTPPLKWSTELATKAKKWAKHLADNDRLEHEPDVPEGENVSYTTKGGRNYRCLILKDHVFCSLGEKNEFLNCLINFSSR